MYEKSTLFGRIKPPVTPKQGDPELDVLEQCCENPIDRILATMTAEKVARKLGVPLPKIHFFYPTDEQNGRHGRLYGRYQDGVVYINARLSEREIERTVVHEVRHHWQALRRKLLWKNVVARERDARLFEIESCE